MQEEEVRAEIDAMQARLNEPIAEPEDEAQTDSEPAAAAAAAAAADEANDGQAAAAAAEPAAAAQDDDEDATEAQVGA